MEDVAAEMLEDFMRELRKKHPRLPALEQAATTLVVGQPTSRMMESEKKLMRA